MKKNHKKKAILVVIALIIITLLSIGVYRNGDSSKTITNFEDCIAAGNPAMESYPRQCHDPISGKTFIEELDEPIGGQRDEHGCLGPAGYSWSEDYGLCVRGWELDDLDKQLLLGASKYLDETYGLTFLETVAGDCDGCYILKLDTLGRPRTIDIKTDGSMEVSLSPEECIAMGGQPLNIVGGDTCPSNQNNVGKVVGFISPNICCVPNNVHACTIEQRNTDVCITLYEPVCGYPLELTFSNSCFACGTDQIDYYIEGECPE